MASNWGQLQWAVLLSTFLTQPCPQTLQNSMPPNFPRANLNPKPATDTHGEWVLATGRAGSSCMAGSTSCQIRLLTSNHSLSHTGSAGSEPGSNQVTDKATIPQRLTTWWAAARDQQVARGLSVKTGSWLYISQHDSRLPIKCGSWDTSGKAQGPLQPTFGRHAPSC